MFPFHVQPFSRLIKFEFKSLSLKDVIISPDFVVLFELINVHDLMHA